MRISVIIPTLNEKAAISGTIRSARAAGADEVIVADGGSGDGTREAAQGTADAVIVASPGRAHQMNAGARASTGKALLFLHADTTLPPGSIDSVRDALASEEIAGGGFRVRLGVSHTAPFARRIALRITARMINFRSRLFRSFTGDQAIFLRRRCFDRIGGYPEIPLMEDVELSRMMNRSGKTVLLPVRVVTSARRWESHGTARTILRMWALRIAYRLGMSPSRCARWYRGLDDPR
jgi:rSAM/selenodomain-associated transferase 2